LQTNKRLVILSAANERPVIERGKRKACHSERSEESPNFAPERLVILSAANERLVILSAANKRLVILSAAKNPRISSRHKIADKRKACHSERSEESPHFAPATPISAL
jgi:hypothetical protein